MNNEQDIDSMKSAACEEVKISNIPVQQSENSSPCCQPSTPMEIPECCRRFEAMSKDDPVSKEQFETYVNRILDFLEHFYVRKDRNNTSN